MQRALAVAVLSCVVAMPLTAEAPPPRAPIRPDVHVFACKVVAGTTMVPKPDEVGLVVSFQNDSAQPLSSLVWRANYEDQPLDFTDVGTCSPSTQIENGVLFEVGTTRTNWLGVLGNVAAAAVRAAPSFKMTKTNIALTDFEGTEEPENCALVRATWAGGRRGSIRTSGRTPRCSRSRRQSLTRTRCRQRRTSQMTRSPSCRVRC